MSHPMFERHRATLDQALAALSSRGYWSPYPESASPRVYGEGAAETGKAAFEALRDKPFALEQPAELGKHPVLAGRRKRLENELLPQQVPDPRHAAVL